MIRRIKEIKDLGVFKEFTWDKCVQDKDQKTQNFQHINILYGRNYSGKTTLSRIFRSFETGVISSKYGNPKYTIEDENGIQYTQSDISSNNLNIRVFNEDFVKENLLFVSNPEECINAFAVLGEGNASLEKEIASLEEALGVNDTGRETGKYKNLRDKVLLRSEKEHEFNTAKSSLIRQLEKKATDSKIGIKYHSEKFGDQNYNISKLKTEIALVIKEEYNPLSEDELDKQNKIVEEKALDTVSSSFVSPNYQLKDFVLKAQNLIEQNITKSEKISELIEDAVKNNWVKEGFHIHEENNKKCAFCGNNISPSRWQTLEKHFDEQSQLLTDSISSLISEIEVESKKYEYHSVFDKNRFYTIFNERIDGVNTGFENGYKKYIESLASLRLQLEKKLINLFSDQEFITPDDNTSDLSSLWSELEGIREESNSYSKELLKNKETAQKKLRINEVYTFVETINYKSKRKELEVLKENWESSISEHSKEQKEINNLLEEIKSRKDMLKDEGNGASKINEYLNNFFGDQYLSISPVEDLGNNKKIRFDIFRQGQKAYHLSEGEVRLLAFCYFLARLEDIETKGKKPIIWIDDPISSLDGNHIFFVYSLIMSEIIKKEAFSQVFISTHNLDFLRYLKRISQKYLDNDGKEKDYNKIFLLVERVDTQSTIRCTPAFLKEYASEFNYLFSQIYKCSKISQITDENYYLFYNFGNNARKFLELYLFYKYPGNLSDDERFEKFFGKGNIPVILIERLNNEYSHLKAQFERGNSPVEEPEMQQIAKLICGKIEEQDKDQYDSLVDSVSFS